MVYSTLASGIRVPVFLSITLALAKSWMESAEDLKMRIRSFHSNLLFLFEIGVQILTKLKSFAKVAKCGQEVRSKCSKLSKAFCELPFKK